MEVSVSQADLDLLTGYYRFCRGYELPEDVTLGDVLEVLENLKERSCDMRDAWDQEDAYLAFEAALAQARALLSQFKKED